MKTEAAALHIGGWYDIFLHGTLQNYAGLSKPGSEFAQQNQRLLIGPWFHSPWSSPQGSYDQRILERNKDMLCCTSAPSTRIGSRGWSTYIPTAGR